MSDQYPPGPQQPGYQPGQPGYQPQQGDPTASTPYGNAQPYGQPAGPYGPSGPQRPGAATGASVLGIVSGSLGLRGLSGLSLRGLERPVRVLLALRMLGGDLLGRGLLSLDLRHRVVLGLTLRR